MSTNAVTAGGEASGSEPDSAGIVDVSGMTVTEFASFVDERDGRDVGVHRRGGRTFVVVD